MNKFQEEFEHYIRTVYPEGISGLQRKELHAAYFAAGSSFVFLMDEIAKMPDERAVWAMEKLRKEIMQTCKAIAQSPAPHTHQN